MSISKSVENEVKAVNLIDHLECQVCLDFAVGPIHSCKNGHLICGFCKPNIVRCPTCEDKDLSVMWILERILKSEGVKFPCRNKDSGCTMMIKSHEMKNHLDTQCDFREIKCENIYWGCKELLAPNQLFQHWLNHHLLGLMEQDSTSGVHGVATFSRNDDVSKLWYSFYIENGQGPSIGCWPSKYFQMDNETFLCHVEAKRENIYIWLTLLGSEKMAKTYKYSAVVTSKLSESPKKQIRFDEIPVHCLQYCDLQRTIDSGHSATLSFSTLRFLHDVEPSDPDEKFNWNVNLEVFKHTEVGTGSEVDIVRRCGNFAKLCIQSMLPRQN